MSPQPTRRGDPEPPDPLPIPVVDNHTHLDISRDDAPITLDDLTPVLAAAAAVGVDRVIQIGCDPPGVEFAVAAAQRHPGVLAGVAIHPNEVPALAAAGRLDDAVGRVEELSGHPRVRVIGETGLDHFRTGPDGHAVQEEAFRRHIEIAKRAGLALQIHDRDAHDDVLRVLSDAGAPDRTVLHCFSGDLEMARECARRGYYLSFSGTVTFTSAKGLRDALAVTPVELLLVETDAPYLTPHPWRGASNSPMLVPLTVRAMAAVLGMAVPTLCEALSENAERLYGPWS